MPDVTEGRQYLRCDHYWEAVKWDTSNEFIASMEGALKQLPPDGVKAVDVVAVRSAGRRPKTLLVAEFKDFAHPAIPADQKARVAKQALSDELTRNIVRKLIDSLAGATFAHDSNDERCSELDNWRPALARERTKLLVLICVEVPKSQQLAILPWTKQLQKRLRWLGPRSRVIVTSSAAPFQGTGLTYSL